MAYLKRASLLIMGLLLFALAACSGNPTGGNTPTANAQTMQQAGKSDAYNAQVHSQDSSHKDGKAQSGMQVASQQNNSHKGNSNAATIIHTAMVTINGKATTILTTASGRTLYYRTSDPAPNSTCTGACAKTWPALIANGKLVLSAALQGYVSVHRTANGNQVEFNGHPLYTYAGDMAAAQVNGQGLGGVWYVAALMQQQQQPRPTPQPQGTPQPQPQGTPQPSHW